MRLALALVGVAVSARELYRHRAGKATNPSLLGGAFVLLGACVYLAISLVLGR